MGVRDISTGFADGVSLYRDISISLDCHEGIATNFDDAVSSEIPQIVLMWDVIRDIATCVLMGRYQWAGFVDGLS